MKKWFKGILYLLTSLAFVAIGTNANATFFSGSVTGQWLNPIAGENDVAYIRGNDAGNTTRFIWGEPASNSFTNKFKFDGVGSDGDSEWEVEEEVEFLLGDFTYRNGSTYKSGGVKGVDLDVMISLTSPEEMDYNFSSFGFTINNTPNTSGNPVTDGDIVTLANNTTGNSFTYGGIEYTLDIMGFSQDSGQTFTYDFSSPEGATAKAGLYGKISQTGGGAQVPEPATIFLLGSGLLGLFGYRKKFWKPKK
jgi:hypothetical protein